MVPSNFIDEKKTCSYYQNKISNTKELRKSDIVICKCMICKQDFQNNFI